MPSRSFLLTPALAVALLAPLAPAASAIDADLDPPIIGFGVPTAAYDVWHTDTVTVQVDVSDPGGTGVRSVEYLLTGASERAGTLPLDGGPVEISAEGHTTMYVTAFDDADQRADGVLQVGIDRTPPIISVSSPQDGIQVERGSEVPIHFSCTDDHSGINGCAGPRVLDTTTLGRHAAILTARDRVGREQTRAISYEVVPPRFAVSGAVAVAGEPQVGQLLRVDLPRLTPAATFGYQWLADGAAIPGATAASYRIMPTDVGRRLSVTITGTAPEYHPWAETSAATTAVQKASSRLRVRARSLPGRTARLDISVTAAGTTASGRVVVTRGGRTVGQGRLDRSGDLRLVLRRQSTGRTVYVVRYAGSAGVEGDTARARLTIRPS
ncbi:hypothetical protein KM427_18800 [Nocardioides sp. LMS-CY]|uniref:hypothetical protein n=1 Tax=Nocardioides sp. (strain LMS-CY) TaxID=2840457 RepID=UPI001BFFFBB1|nr:hypothetical protein [Nocardioides sp. LMS-CY]QWF20983.1 hypothetical protein KM427_18800 [Nocardioides sp. LMS-CY]